MGNFKGKIIWAELYQFATAEIQLFMQSLLDQVEEVAVVHSREIR